MKKKIKHIQALAREDEDFSPAGEPLDRMIEAKRKECLEIEYKNGLSLIERLKPYVELNSLLHMKIMQNLEKI